MELQHPSAHQHDRAALIARLHIIEGQIRGITKMLEEDKSCEQIIIQIGAVNSAIHKLGQKIFEEHLESCVVSELKNKDEQEVLDGLLKVFEQFTRLI